MNGRLPRRAGPGRRSGAAARPRLAAQEIGQGRGWSQGIEHAEIDLDLGRTGGAADDTLRRGEIGGDRHQGDHQKKSDRANNHEHRHLEETKAGYPSVPRAAAAPFATSRGVTYRNPAGRRHSQFVAWGFPDRSRSRASG